MNEDIERLNRENERQNEAVSPGDQSKWRNSEITTNQDDKKRSLAEGIISDLSNQRADIDVIKQTITEIGNQVNIITQALNKIVNGQIPQAQGIQTEGGKGLNMEAIGQLGDVAEKLFSAYKSIKGEPTGAPPIIDQNMINERMKQSFMDELDTGASITKFIKDSLKKKVTREVINTSFKEMGTDSHAPQ